MSSDKRTLSLAIVLVVVLLSSSLLSACSSSYPSEADAMKALNARNTHLFKVTSLRKTDGQAMEAFGVKGYKMEYEAETQCTAVNARRTGLFGGMTFGETACYEIGQTQKIKGSISFQKTENGWQAMPGDVGEP